MFSILYDHDSIYWVINYVIISWLHWKIYGEFHESSASAAKFLMIFKQFFRQLEVLFQSKGHWAFRIRIALRALKSIEKKELYKP